MASHHRTAAPTMYYYYYFSYMAKAALEKIEEEDGKSGMIHKSPSSWHFSPLSQFSFFYTEQDVVCLLLME